MAKGITDVVYDLLHWVECHYDINCTYDEIQEDEEIPSIIKRWKRNCQCRLHLSDKIVEKSFDMRIRQEIKYGNGERWYELSWIQDQYGRSFTGQVRYV